MSIAIGPDGKDLESGLIIDQAKYRKWRRGLMPPERLEEERRLRREYYYRNRERMKAANRRWVAENRERYRGAVNEASKRKFREDPRYRASVYLQIKLAKGVDSIRRGYFPEQWKPFIGCTWKEFRAHIEGQFVDGMVWENYGVAGGWEIDHISPRSKYDLTKQEEVLVCFYYKNLRPLWKRQNAGEANRPRVDLEPVPTEAVLKEMAGPKKTRSGRKKAFLASEGLIPR